MTTMPPSDELVDVELGTPMTCSLDVVAPEVIVQPAGT